MPKAYGTPKPILGRRSAAVGGSQGNEMKRHKSLHPLSEHHHHALVQALEIRRARKGSPAERAAALRKAGVAFLRFWKVAGKLHFREEEEVLLPAYALHARLDENPRIMRMLAEHALIRARVGQLEEALAAQRPVEGEVEALGRLLHEHVRLEEDEIFPHIEATLSQQEMAALELRFSRLHSAERIRRH
jgi:hemerythrin-like domain-containing protein